MSFPEFSHRAAKTLRIFAILLGAFYAILFLALVAMRLGYPYELEFMEGVIADHCLRIAHGLPVYAKPSINFVALLYPPLYYHVSAFAMLIVGETLVALRAVSLFATLGSCLVIFLLVRRETAGPFYPIIGSAIFIAGFGVTGYFYDAARVDALLVFLVLTSISVTLHARRPTALLSAALLFALAFFTKQQALMFAGTATFWLLIKDWKQAVIFAVALSIFIFGGIAFFNAINNGWFSYYVFGIPSAKRAEFSWYSFFVILSDESFKHWGVATLAVVSWILLRSKERLQFLRSSEGLLTLFFLCAVVAMMFSYGNLGGYRNITMPMVAMISVMFPIVLRQFESRGLHPVFASLAILIQFCALWIIPVWQGKLFSSNQNVRAGETLIRDLAQRPGAVLLPSHGYLAYLAKKPMHFHEVSYNDALLMRDGFAHDLRAEHDSAIASEHFSAIILDETPYSRPDSIPGYTLAGRVFTDEHSFYSKLLDVATRPQYVYLPK